MKWIRDKFVGKWYSGNHQALGPFVSLFSPFGLWPLDEDNVSLKIRWCISTISMASLVIQAIYESYLNCLDIENNSDNLNIITFGVLGLSKLCFYYKYRDILRENIESAIGDWSSEKSESSRSIMRNCKSNYEKVTKCLLVVGTCSGILWIIKTLFVKRELTKIVRRDKNSEYGNVTTVLIPRFLLPLTCTFNDGPQWLYWTIFVIQVFQFCIIAGVNLFGDGFFIAITSHLCAQFEILKINFGTHLNSNNETETRENFSILVARHTHLLKLAQQLETAFSMIVLTQMVMNTVALNTAGLNFLVLLKKNKMLSAVTNSTIIQFTLGQTFVYCYIGDWLTCQGENIALSVYHCKWYLMPTSLSKDVIFVIKRTKFPIGLSAGNFRKMTRGTFTSILTTAVSYLSVLRIIIKDI